MQNRFESSGKAFPIKNCTDSLLRKHEKEILRIDKVIVDKFGKGGWKKEKFLMHLPQKENLSFIVLEDDVAVAFMIASKYESIPKVHLSRIAVLERLQGLGIGRALMDLLHARCAAMRIEEITLSTKYAGEDDTLLKWYSKFGYALITDEKEIDRFLHERKKEREKGAFWPWNASGNLIVMKKRLS